MNNINGRVDSIDGITGIRQKAHLRLVTDNSKNTSSISKPSTIQLNIEIKKLQQDIKKLQDILTLNTEISSDILIEGDGNMEELIKKVNEIDKKVALLEERTKKIDSMPSKDEMKYIISSIIDGKNIPSKHEVENSITKIIKENDLPTNSDVSLKIEKAKNTQIRWTIGTIITIVSVATAIIKYL